MAIHHLLSDLSRSLLSNVKQISIAERAFKKALSKERENRLENSSKFRPRRASRQFYDLLILNIMHLMYLIESPFNECVVRCIFNGIEAFSRNHMRSSTVEVVYIVTNKQSRIDLIQHVFQTTQREGQG